MLIFKTSLSRKKYFTNTKSLRNFEVMNILVYNASLIYNAEIFIKTPSLLIQYKNTSKLLQINNCYKKRIHILYTIHYISYIKTFI